VSREVVHTSDAPGPFQGAPYSQAVRANGFVFVAGQLGFVPGGDGPVDGGAGAQTAQALANLERILLAAGSSLARVVKTTVFLQDLGDFAAMNEVYAARFPADPPARSTVEVARLPSGALVEIEAIALAGEDG
jgi:2-iminobutanoate/2-iminopropanoate deaminase